MSDILLIGSCEPFSGKSALVLGIAKRLLHLNFQLVVGDLNHKSFPHKDFQPLLEYLILQNHH